MRSLVLPWVLLVLLAPEAAGAKGKGGARRGPTSYAVVVPAASEQEAKDRLTALVDVYVYARILGYEGIPRVAKAQELGLAKPPEGAEWFVVLSYCPKREATSRVAAVRDRAPGVTATAATDSPPDSCLGRRAFVPMGDDERGYVDAIVQNPQAAQPRVYYAGFLQSETRFAEAERVLVKALEIDPNNEQAKSLLQVSRLMGRF